jgi:hypothetical protein
MTTVTTVTDNGQLLRDAAFVAIVAELHALSGKQVVITINDAASVARTFDVLSPDELIERITHLDKLAGTHVEYTNINAVLDMLNELSGWLSECGRAQACAKYYMLTAHEMTMATMPEHVRSLSITERRAWVAAKCAAWESQYERAERLTAAITHRCDHLRTFVSYEKELAKAAIQQV